MIMELILLGLHVLNDYSSVILFTKHVTIMTATVRIETKFILSVFNGLSFAALISVLIIVNLAELASVSSNSDTITLKLDAVDNKSTISIDCHCSSGIKRNLDGAQAGPIGGALSITIYAFSCVIDAMSSEFIAYDPVHTLL